jgi:predicted metal-binding protein
METISLQEYGKRVGCKEHFNTLQEIQDYVEEYHDCTLWDYPLEELEYAKENCEGIILVETEFGVRICEV